MHVFEVQAGITQEVGGLQFHDFSASVADKKELGPAIRVSHELVHHARGILGDALVLCLHQPEGLGGLFVDSDFLPQLLLRQSRLDGCYGDGRQVSEGSGVGRAELPGHRIKHTKRPKVHPVRCC